MCVYPVVVGGGGGAYFDGGEDGDVCDVTVRVCENSSSVEMWTRK